MFQVFIPYRSGGGLPGVGAGTGYCTAGRHGCGPYSKHRQYDRHAARDGRQDEGGSVLPGAVV